jgi:peptide/nickel transport system permease protein
MANAAMVGGTVGLEASPEQGLDVVRGTRFRSRTNPRRRVLVSGGFIVAVVALGVLAPVLPLLNPLASNLLVANENVGAAGHLLGTDELGRDVLSRLIWGSRLSLLMGIVPVVIGGALGILMGVTAGLGRPAVRGGIMRTLDVFYAFPAVLLAIAIAASLGPGVRTVIIAVTVIIVPPIARVAEGEVRSLTGRDFMLAARASGARRTQIAIRQVLPNVAGSLVVYCTALVGLSIVYSAGLGFLGLGITPPTPEWGEMVNELRAAIFTEPLVALAPAIVLLVVSIAFNAFGDGLRDLFGFERARA